MSYVRDTLSERNIEKSRPSTAQLSTSQQPFRSKSSLNNKIMDNKLIAAQKKSPKHASTSRKNPVQGEAETNTRILTNSLNDDISSQCQNLNINDSAEVVEADNTKYPKRKNSKKKERLKKLKMPAASSEMALPMPQAESIFLDHSVSNSVHEFFAKQICPMYASTSSKYLENLSHHPQFVYMKQQQEVHLSRQHAASVPNTPLQQHTASGPNTPLPKFVANSPNRPLQQHFNSTPNTPLLQMPSTNSKGFLHNMMQHPLLRQPYGFRGGDNYGQSHPNGFHQNYVRLLHQSDDDKKKKRTPRKKTEQKDVDKRFEPYMPVEEVEKGLKNNTLLQGVLRINPKQFQHSYVSGTDRSEQDILIDGLKHRNRALEGDIVVVQYIEDTADKCEGKSEDTEEEKLSKQKRGKVVAIKEKVHRRTCIGYLKLMPDKNRQKALFVPRDHRVPRLNIPFICWPDNFYEDAKAYENTLFLAKITDWFDIRFALGTIECNIGQAGDMKTETKAILAQTCLDITPYGPEVRDLYPRLDYTIPEEEIKLREDCRKLCVYSIDPFNCRDIDDAVSCRELDNGNYEIGVHISDVSHFLTENTILDGKVAEKATTVYLVEKAYHMLPDDLCMLCSLFPGVDKLAFSVFWEITPEGNVLSHRFAKTVIHSCAQLAYEHAQAVLDDTEGSEAKFPDTFNGFTYQDIYKSIKIVGKIAAIFRKKRFEGGALRIDQPKVAFHLSPTNGLPESFWIYESKQSHQLIEEFMLLANMTVATRIHDDHPKLAFLRCHPPPSLYMMTQLAKSLKPMGIDLEIDSAGNLHHSLQAHVGGENADKGKAMVLNMLCAKPMTRAKYFCAGSCDEEDDFGHYALNVPLYTHFTSPIRRYADIMVHRLLSASLKYREEPKWEIDEVRMIAAQCNKQKYNAKKASELSTELYTLKYIELHSPLVTEAVVVEVREKYIDVIIVAMGLNRRIFFNNDFPGEYKCIKNTSGIKLSKMVLTWNAVDKLPKIRQVINVFSILQVELHRADDTVKVETKLVRPLETEEGEDEEQKEKEMNDN